MSFLSYRSNVYREYIDEEVHKEKILDLLDSNVIGNEQHYLIAYEFELSKSEIESIA